MEQQTYSFVAEGRDEELRMLAVIDNALQLLEPEERLRVLAYLAQRHSIR